MKLSPSLGIPKQLLLGDRTSRMLSLDLRDCEREIATCTTSIFSQSGVSYPRADLEIALFNDDLSIVTCPPREEFDPSMDPYFPDQISRIDRLWAERRQLFLRLMSKSLDWKRSLDEYAGQVAWMTDAVTGETTPIGSAGDAWSWLREDPDAIPDPAFEDALFDDCVDDRDISPRSPEYSRLEPWLMNDVDEKLVAQWYYEHTGFPPWSRSWESYQLLATPENQWKDWMRSFNGMVEQIKSVARRAGELRQGILNVRPAEDPRQLVLPLKGGR